VLDGILYNTCVYLIDCTVGWIPSTLSDKIQRIKMALGLPVNTVDVVIYRAVINNVEFPFFVRDHLSVYFFPSVLRFIHCANWY
jgi:hypothetical protein